MHIPPHLQCDLCLGGTPAAAYLVSAFHVETPLENIHNCDGAWAACALCAPMVDGDRLDDLVARCVRVMEPRGMPAIPIVFQHYRMLIAAILRHRSDRLEFDDPRLAGLAHTEGDPIGVHMSPVRADGTVTVVPIPAAPPHPFRP